MLFVVGREPLEYCLTPRSHGSFLTLAHDKHLSCIYDVTFAYETTRKKVGGESHFSSELCALALPFTAPDLYSTSNACYSRKILQLHDSITMTISCLSTEQLVGTETFPACIIGLMRKSYLTT